MCEVNGFEQINTANNKCKKKGGNTRSLLLAPTSAVQDI
jgi:hypothetical protein